MPIISVLLPAYNSGLYIKEAISSILNQTFTDFELLIFNDGSNDNTEEIILSFNDERIIYKKYACNVGYLSLLNEGIEMAKGNYIARMDADDISMPTRFESQIAFLEENPDVGICGTWMEIIGKDSEVARTPVSFEDVVYVMFFGSPMAHPTIMMRMDLIQKFKLRYEIFFYYAEDYQLFSEAFFHFKLANLPLVLLKYRIHNSQISNTKWREQFILKSYIQAKLFCKAITDVSKPDFIFLCDFFSEKSIPDVDWLESIGLYKKRIIEGNKKNAVYPHDILIRATNELFESKIKRNFYRYFFQKYYNRKSFNPILLFQFLMEKDKPHQYFGKKLTLFFIIKCMVGYRKKTIQSE